MLLVELVVGGDLFDVVGAGGCDIIRALDMA